MDQLHLDQRTQKRAPAHDVGKFLCYTGENKKGKSSYRVWAWNGMGLIILSDGHNIQIRGCSDVLDDDAKREFLAAVQKAIDIGMFN